MRITSSISGSRRTWSLLFICCLLLGYLILPLNGDLSTTVTVRAADPTVWSLVWSDEFDGSNGAEIGRAHV